MTNPTTISEEALAVLRCKYGRDKANRMYAAYREVSLVCTNIGRDRAKAREVKRKADIIRQQIADLVASMVSDPAKKEAMKATLTELGIEKLPDLVPEEYALVYSRFAEIRDNKGGTADADLS